MAKRKRTLSEIVDKKHERLNDLMWLSVIGYTVLCFEVFAMGVIWWWHTYGDTNNEILVLISPIYIIIIGMALYFGLGTISEYFIRREREMFSWYEVPKEWLEE